MVVEHKAFAMANMRERIRDSREGVRQIWWWWVGYRSDGCGGVGGLFFSWD